MELAELLERETIADGDQLLDWARQRAAALIAEFDSEDSLRSLLEPEGEADVDEVPVARRRRRVPSSPQPQSADELPPPPEHPRLADGEPEPILEHVDTGPIDLEDEFVRRKIREDSWAIQAYVVESDPVVEAEVEPMSEPSIEIEVEPEAPLEPAIRADSDAPAQRAPQRSEPELPVVVRPAESFEAPIAEEDEEEFEVDELDELEVDELVELDEELDEGDDDEEATKPPRPPPPKSAPPPIRNEVADMIASLAEPVRTGDTAVTRIDEVEGAPAKADDVDIDVDLD